MIRYIGSLLCVLALATLAVGSNCHVQRVVVRQHYVAPIVAHDYLPYAIGYNPANEQLEAFKFFLDKYDQRTEQLIQALKVAPGGGPLLPIKAAHPGDLVMANKCAVCHDETTAKAKGKGKVLFKGGAFLDTQENRSAVIGEAIEAGTMPQGKPLTAEEKVDLMRRLLVTTSEK